MTHRERMEAVFRGERPDVMAWFGDLTYWYDAHRTIGDLPERWQGPNGLHELHQELNIGEYIPGCDPCDVVEGDGVSCEVTDDGELRVTKWHTPVGTVREVQEYSRISFSWGYTEHSVKEAGDLGVVRHIFENRNYIPLADRPQEQRLSSAAYAKGVHQWILKPVRSSQGAVPVWEPTAKFGQAVDAVAAGGQGPAAGTYWVALRIPWDSLPKPKPGQTLGFDLGINGPPKTGDGRKTQIMLFGTSSNAIETAGFGQIAIPKVP